MNFRRRVQNRQAGLTFIEVLVALAILSTIAVAFLMGLAASTHAVIVADERVTAEALAKSQMESVKFDDYQAAPANGVSPDYSRIDADIPEGYHVYSQGRTPGQEGWIDGIVGVPWNNTTGQAVAADVGLQKVSLVIWREDGDDQRLILELEGFKASR